MKIVLGLLLIVLGLVLGVWLGFIVLFVGAIKDIIALVQGTMEVTAMRVALIVVRMFFAGTVGFLSAMFPIGFGYALVTNEI